MVVLGLITVLYLIFFVLMRNPKNLVSLIGLVVMVLMCMLISVHPAKVSASLSPSAISPTVKPFLSFLPLGQHIYYRSRQRCCEANVYTNKSDAKMLSSCFLKKH